MPDEELAALLAAHESRAIGYYHSEIADEQAKAINYYYGIMDDLPALDGCSQVVDHSVAVMVDNALAAVLKPFVSADEIVAFGPRGPEDQRIAEQATEYVNYVINCDNPGFLIFHNWFKDALLTKIGVVKVWWEDRSREEVTHQPVDAAGLEALRADPSYLGEAEVEPGIFLARMQREVPDGRVRIESVPPEEFLITPFARTIEEASYVAHRPRDHRRSDLIELGFDAEVVESLPAFSEGSHDEPRGQARYRDEQYRSAAEATGSDRSRDVIGVIDEYVRVDYDQDGISELRRIIRAGDIILFNEPVDEIPFALLCPCPMPHKVYGRALADQSIEGQKVSTAILRQTLDNLYKANNPRPVLGEGALGESTIADIGDSAPGAVIRCRDSGQLGWASVPFTAGHSFPMLEYIARQTEERTGVQRKGNGLNAEALKKNSPHTATQAAIDENSRNERAEMIARIFAETGVKRLFKLVLGLLVRHQPRERVIRLRNEWVPMDPSGWSAEMDVTISVGLGIGNKAEQIGQAQTVLEAMERLAGTPYAYLVGPGHVHKAIRRLYNAAGIKNVDDYLGDPEQLAPPEPRPDPKAAEAQAKIRIEQARLQARMQSDAAARQAEAATAQARMQLEQAQAQFRAMLDQQKAAAEQQLAAARAQFEAQLAMAESRADLELERERLKIQRELGAAAVAARTVGGRGAKRRRNRPGGSLAE